MNRLELKVPPPVVALCLALLMGLAPSLARPEVSLQVRVGLALVLVLIGFAIGISGIVAFRRARTTISPVNAGAASSLVSSWQMTASSSRGAPSRPSTGGPGALPGGPGALPGETGSAGAGPQTAGFLDAFNPREILRKATVYLMKDRAGTVGAHGVGPMLTRILEIGKARVHLTGHSYGAKVVLSALTVPDHGGRKVRSVLLLQPAVNHLCFAANVDGRVGGYRPALERSERPIYTTFSSRDAALAKFFHIAVRRDGDLAEQSIAAAPSQFAALGGFGPGGLKEGEMRTLDLLDPGNRYPAPDATHRIFALDGSGNRITSHGDVRNPFTEWALIDLTL